MVVMDVKDEPSGERYRALISFAMRHCNRFSLIVRSKHDIDHHCDRVLEHLSEFLVLKSDVSSWPGTELLGSTATKYEYVLSTAAGEALCTHTTRLFEWVHPSLPEDLCLLRGNGDAWLTTIAHERDAYLRLSGEELVEFGEALPGITLTRSTAYH